MPVWNVYLLKCRDESLYCGIATSVERRLAEHNAGKGAKYMVAGRRPAVCVWTRRVEGQGAALKLEYWLKRLPTARKRLIAEGVMTVRRSGDGWTLCARPRRKQPEAHAGSAGRVRDRGDGEG